MTVQTFYRSALWLPLLLPGIVAVAVHIGGLRPDDGPLDKAVQLLLISGIYGGPAYLIVAAWGTWWVDHRPEPEIRRRALRAPLLMLAGWIALAAMLGAIFGRLEVFTGLAGLGAVMIVSLGYLYVGLTFLLRRLLDLEDGARPAPTTG